MTAPSRYVYKIQEVTFEQFRKDLLAKGLVESVQVLNNELARVKLKDGTERHFQIGSVESFEQNLDRAQRELGLSTAQFLPVTFKREIKWGSLFLDFLPPVLFIGLLIYGSVKMAGSIRGGGKGGKGGPLSRIFSVGKSPATVIKEGDIKTTFNDVAGLDEAKVEIMEFVEFLRDPDKFRALGAKIPKGALLVGPPGTGKTLLGKAVAGEAKVPFFSIAGSDFMEMFVGVGPSRVRDLFKQARENSPCIIFIDEIDAIGRARNKSGMGSHDERENTLNQILVEMDGLKTLAGVVVLAGTNRADVLDPALVRAGRFDRHINVELPDINARKQIFEVHLKPLTLAEKLETHSKKLAALTPGMSGAEIANVCNEAALRAARENRAAIEFVDFEYAIDRVIAGLERKSRVLSPQEKKYVAYHEAGHAVTGWFLEHADPLLKVSIVPRGANALGFTQYLPKEQFLQSKAQLQDMMCMMLGGRTAEQIFFNHTTTGAADDLQRVTRLAYAQVTQLGMDETVGPIHFPAPRDGELQLYKPYSEHTAQKIDEQARHMVKTLQARTFALLTEKKEDVIKLAERLLLSEVISQDDVVELLGPRPFAKATTYQQFVYGDGKDGKESVDAKGTEGVVKS
eukprot:TRINITY_DN3783_c0_g1_i1.p1 TRINITY_DN3783_c0_g1~~TRINITY_DN3783_c0_g1_i1.p1  ORF type:complete len:642 (-),score=157.85 TRINITY_DN3783_c0_g1_i1:20-1900(-)